MKRNPYAALVALLISAPAAAQACINAMNITALETVPLDFLWLGNGVAALLLLAFRKELATRRSMQRAFVASCLIGSAGFGLFMSNTLELHAAFSPYAALLVGFVLANFKIERTVGESILLVFLLGVSGLAAVDAIDDAARFDDGLRPSVPVNIVF